MHSFGPFDDSGRNPRENAEVLLIATVLLKLSEFNVGKYTAEVDNNKLGIEKRFYGGKDSRNPQFCKYIITSEGANKEYFSIVIDQKCITATVEDFEGRIKFSSGENFSVLNGSTYTSNHLGFRIYYPDDTTNFESEVYRLLAPIAGILENAHKFEKVIEEEGTNTPKQQDVDPTSTSHNQTDSDEPKTPIQESKRVLDELLKRMMENENSSDGAE